MMIKYLNPDLDVGADLATAVVKSFWSWLVTHSRAREASGAYWLQLAVKATVAR